MDTVQFLRGPHDIKDPDAEEDLELLGGPEAGPGAVGDNKQQKKGDIDSRNLAVSAGDEKKYKYIDLGSRTNTLEPRSNERDTFLTILLDLGITSIDEARKRKREVAGLCLWKPNPEQLSFLLGIYGRFVNLLKMKFNGDSIKLFGDAVTKSSLLRRIFKRFRYEELRLKIVSDCPSIPKQVSEYRRIRNSWIARVDHNTFLRHSKVGWKWLPTNETEAMKIDWECQAQSQLESLSGSVLIFDKEQQMYHQAEKIPDYLVNEIYQILGIGTVVDVGLLVVSPQNISRLPAYYFEAKHCVRNKLYVRVQGVPLEQVLNTIYNEASKTCPQLDVRVLLRNDLPNFDRAFGDNVVPDVPTHQPKYKKVVLGGTFDRLHNGHKVLLSEAALLASQSITCGVTDKDMIKQKTLFELIEPVDRRMKAVCDFIRDVSTGVECVTEPIEDAFGPSIREHDLEAIIVSQGTVGGSEAVNKKRLERKMRQLDTEMIELLEADDAILAENKISSSSRRREALGTLLRKPNEYRERPLKPYIIGLTGGIASGKSTIGQFLSKFNDHEVLDCDIVAHECFARGSDLVHQIEESFPGTVEDGVVNRPELGRRVFNNKEELHKLNNLVWPAVRKEVERRISHSDKRVVFVEAAALVEAGWDSYMDEVWTVFVSPEEAIHRVKERGLAKESEATKNDDSTKKEHARKETEARVAEIHTQLSNSERIEKSNVVFCSRWTKDATESQVLAAVWSMYERI